MAKVRVDKSLKEELKNFLDESDVWNKQSEFVNQAIREKLERETSEISIEDIRKMIQEDIESP